MTESEHAIHTGAATGYGAASATHVGGRQDCPPAIAVWLTGIVGLARGRSVVDLGAGTGEPAQQVPAPRVLT